MTNTLTKTKEERKNKSNLIQVRLDDDTKSELELILNQLGLTTSQAVLMYIKQIVMKKRIPIELTTTVTTTIFDDTELTKKEFQQQQGYLVSKLDEGEVIPELHENNSRAFVF